MRYEAYTPNNVARSPVAELLPAEVLDEILTVAVLLPFKVNNYIVENLIDWRNYERDPLFRMLFPNREILTPAQYALAKRLRGAAQSPERMHQVRAARQALNPHPDGQLDFNRPSFEGDVLEGVQHKYRETLLFFPEQAQTCHAYCAFCFRWAQFVGDPQLKMASADREQLYGYLSANEEITDILITGGDPLVMKAKLLRHYLEPLLNGACAHVRNIRIGTKALAFWPFRFTSDDDAADLLQLLSDLRERGRSVSIMAHLSHWRELDAPAAREAVRNIRGTGAALRTQAPLLRFVNDRPEVWTKMWKLQVELGMVPYYMFVARLTGASRYYALPLDEAATIYHEALRGVSGLARTVRGPTMSTFHGKVEFHGRMKVGAEDVFMLRFLQARNPEWNLRPFFATYNREARWLTDLNPAFGEQEFFFERGAQSVRAADRRTCVHG